MEAEAASAEAEAEAAAVAATAAAAVEAEAGAEPSEELWPRALLASGAGELEARQRNRLNLEMSALAERLEGVAKAHGYRGDQAVQVGCQTEPQNTEGQKVDDSTQTEPWEPTAAGGGGVESGGGAGDAGEGGGEEAGEEAAASVQREVYQVRRDLLHPPPPHPRHPSVPRVPARLLLSCRRRFTPRLPPPSPP